MSQSLISCQKETEFIRNSLLAAGFFVNVKKSVFSPVQELEWLGLSWNSIDFTLRIPERRISDAKACLNKVISLLPLLTARQLASFTGKIISMSPVMGNIVNLMTKRCYKVIQCR